MLQAADGSRIVLLSVAVKEIILSLLNHPTDSSLKATVQVLKVSECALRDLPLLVPDKKQITQWIVR